MLGYSFLLTLIIGLLIKYTIGFRVTPEEEAAGIDEAEHKETAYDFGGFGGGGGGTGHAAGNAAKPPAKTTGTLEETKA